MFESLNISVKKIYKNGATEAAFLFACGHLRDYIRFSKCINAVPGDRYYEQNIDECMLGKENLELEKLKSGKKCVRNLFRIKAVEGYLKAYDIKTDKGYYEDQDLVLTAFEEYLSSVNFSLDGRRFFDEANKLL